MPVENERKFVLKLDTSEKDFAKLASRIDEIEQIYLVFGEGRSVRIRKTSCGTCRTYEMTFKQDVDGKTVEIETKIDKKDYDLLSKGALLKLCKTRYKIKNWDVDFFKDGSIYFVQAEIEMPENQENPDAVPDFIKNNLVYTVKKDDRRFSSKKLGDVKYARRLMDSLMKGQK